MSGDGFREVGVAEAVALARDGFQIIDVREQAEWDAGHVAGATLLPLGDVVARIGEVVPDRATRLLLHCAVGRRSALAADELVKAGYSNVISLKGPIGGWKDAGGQWEAPRELLSPSQTRRYARQTVMPEIGAEGQRRLLDARVVIIGVGGLGSPAALYLAAAGVGLIGLVDDDVVEESNLQRQVVHGLDRLGTLKVDSAERTLRGMNPEARVATHPERLTADNVDRLIKTYDVVVDGTDSVGPATCSTTPRFDCASPWCMVRYTAGRAR